VTGSLDDAYRLCESITREQARNFYYGIRLLPAAKRSVLWAVYALARRVDDIGDGDLPTEEKVRALASLLSDLSAIEGASDPVLAAVADAARRYPIPLAAFTELVDGVEMDVTGRRYQTFEDLVGYCRCVAGSIGRLCLGVFGSRPDPRAPQYADALGIALQQTNILRDIREDLINGRVYLPSDDLKLFDVELRLAPDGSLDPCDGRLAELIRFEAARAWGRYDEGLQLLGLLDRRSAACCAAMAGIYRELLVRIAADPRPVYATRLSLPPAVKARVAARALVRPGR